MIAYLGNTIIQIYSDQLTEMALGGKWKRMNLGFQRPVERPPSRD